jgi:hypothetical protein
MGSIRLAPGAVLPSYAPQDMERKVLDQLERGTLPETCTPPKTTDRTPVRMTPDGKLIGVMVTVSDFKKNPERAPRIYDVAIRDCRLTPSLVVAARGDSLRITNEVAFPFMPSYGKDPVLKTLMPGQVKDVPLQEPGVSPVLCGFTAPCGRTDVVVLHHPLYTVTGEDGTFRIENFPADENVTVSAWHPLFNAGEQKVTLGQGETKVLDLAILPREQPAAQPTAAQPTAQ